MKAASSGQVGFKMPVVDLFAGPGGLGEGFTNLEGDMFRVAISIEMEEAAHKTLRLRSFFRQFTSGCAPPEYYDYVRGGLQFEELKGAYPREWERADREAWRTELGAEDHALVRARIDEAIGSAHGGVDAVLMGGPPCQAYSLVGRSRMRSVRGADFDSDRRHFLYREYLRILSDHAPVAFVLENVKGMLSSTSGGKHIFSQICIDLRRPGESLNDYRPRHRNVEYELFPLGSLRSSSSDQGNDPPAESFILRADKFGLPQARHRVIVVGIRKDRAERARDALSPLVSSTRSATLADVLTGLPPLRSGISRAHDSDHSWESTVRASADRLLGNIGFKSQAMRDEISRIKAELRTPPSSRGGRFVPTAGAPPRFEPSWFVDPNIGGTLNHESRRHMPDDLTRYLFAAVFSRIEQRPPRLADFPDDLLPNHKNVGFALKGNLFSDRFRVQLPDRPSTTITSHMSKDGHYYIHPDPAQCRSLTVREAARLQTFPDNYFFEGSRTKQYIQVGNAVPPLLARRIAGVLAAALGLLP